MHYFMNQEVFNIPTASLMDLYGPLIGNDEYYLEIYTNTDRWKERHIDRLTRAIT